MHTVIMWDGTGKYDVKKKTQKVTETHSAWREKVYIHTAPWKVSTKAPAPADAKFIPVWYSWFPGCRKGGMNGSFAYSATTN